MDSPAPLRRSTGRLLIVAYVPFLVYSVAAAGWMMWHSVGAIVLVFIWMMIVGLFGLLMGAFSRACSFGGLLACHALGAFAMQSWLKLPKWTTGVFLLGALALLATLFVRAIIASGSADYPYDD